MRDLKGCAAVETADEEEHILAHATREWWSKRHWGDEEEARGWKDVESRRTGTQIEEEASLGGRTRAESGSCGCTGSPV